MDVALPADLELRPVAGPKHDSAQRLSNPHRRSLSFSPELLARIIKRIREI